MLASHARIRAYVEGVVGLLKAGLKAHIRQANRIFVEWCSLIFGKVRFIWTQQTIVIEAFYYNKVNVNISIVN